MNICMVIWKYYPHPEGGAESQCRKIVSELIGRGHRCTIATAQLDRKLAFHDTGPSGEKITRLGRLTWLESSLEKKISKLVNLIWPFKSTPLFLMFWLLFPFRWIARVTFIFSLRHHLKGLKDNIDIVHVHEAHWMAGAAGWAMKDIDKPLVCKEATYPFQSKIGYDTPLRRSLTRWRKDLNFIAITPSIKESMIENGILSEKIDFIPNGVELPPETASIIQSESVVYIGNFTQGAYQKAFDVLFEAWVQIQKFEPRLNLNVLGGGDHSKWSKYLQKNGKDHTVFFHGSVTEVSKYLMDARLFLLPSRIEGLSNALLEAMSWGLPVIVTDIPAHQGLVKNNQNGLIVPANDSDALARAVIELYRNEELSLQLASEARKTIEAEFTIKHVADKLENLYRRISGNIIDLV